MSVDIERLRVDPDYWDEVAPMTGAKYYCPRHRYFLVSHCGCFGSIPRPTKTEWVDGLPNVGDLVRHPRYANPCELKWLGKANCVIESDFGDECFAAFEDLEPLQTPEQRQREELAEIIAERVTVQCGTMMDDWQYDLIADAILSKYNLTEK